MVKKRLLVVFILTVSMILLVSSHSTSQEVSRCQKLSKIYDECRYTIKPDKLNSLLKDLGYKEIPEWSDSDYREFVNSYTECYRNKCVEANTYSFCSFTKEKFLKDRVKDKVISVIKNGKESIIKAKKLKNKITELKNKIDNLYAEKAQLEVTENIKVTENIINELKEIEGEIARSDISHSTIPTNQNTTFNDALTKARELKDFFEEKKNEMGERQLLAEYEKKIEQAKTVSELEKLVDEIYDIHVTSLYEEQDRVADLANKKIRQIRISKKREQMQKYANKAGVLDKYLEKRLYMFAEEDFLLKDFIAAVVKAKQYKKFTKSHLDSNLYILELKNSSELFFKLGKFYPENQQFYDDLSEDVKGYPCFLLSKIKSSKGSKKMSSLRESGMIIDKLYVQFTQISEGYR